MKCRASIVLTVLVVMAFGITPSVSIAESIKVSETNQTDEEAIVETQEDEEIEGTPVSVESMEVDESEEVSSPRSTEEESLHVESDDVSLNASEVTLYALYGNALNKIGAVPNNKPTSFKLEVTNGANPRFIVPRYGSTVTVTDDGLIEPAYETWYYYGSYWSTSVPSDPTGIQTRVTAELGTTTVYVQTDNGTATVDVTVVDYGKEYFEKVLDDYIAQNVRAGMSVYDKVDLACRWVVQFPYNGSYYTAYDMFYCNGGSCWASTDAIVKLCQKMGLHAWARDASYDLGAGSQHENAMIETEDGRYYIAEAGYASDTVPRDYDIFLEDMPWSYRAAADGTTIELMKYDCDEWPTHLDIPERVDGHTVTAIGPGCMYGATFESATIPSTVKSIGKNAFRENQNLKTLEIPESVESIGRCAFYNCPSLWLTVSPSNRFFSAEDNVLYDKGKTILYAARNVKSVTIPNSVTSIEATAFDGNKRITKVVIPASVTSIGGSAFWNTSSDLSLWFLSDTAPQVGQNALGMDSEHRIIHVPYGATGYDVEPWTNHTVLGPSIENGTIQIDCDYFVYDGKAKIPNATVMLDGRQLVDGVDYDVSARGDNVSAGMVECVISGKNGYSGQRILHYTIARASIRMPIANDYTYRGSAQVGVANGEGYVVSGMGTATDAGTYEASVTPDNNHCWADGTTSARVLKWRIDPRDVTPMVVFDKQNYEYTGGEVRPTISVMVGNTVLTEKDYVLAYASDCREVGTYDVKVTLRGNYSGSATASYSIVPARTVAADTEETNESESENAGKPARTDPIVVTIKGTKIAKLKAAKRAITAKWKKRAAQIDGYQIQYSTKKSFKSAKIKSVKGAKKTSAKLKKLKSKKRYYVRIRTWRKVGGKTYYSDWSKVKTVKVK